MASEFRPRNLDEQKMAQQNPASESCACNWERTGCQAIPNRKGRSAPICRMQSQPKLASIGSENWRYLYLATSLILL